MSNLKQPTKLSFKNRQIFAGYLFIIPLIIGVALFLIPNLLRTVIFSFSEIAILPRGQGYSLQSVGLKNYVTALFEDAKFNRLVVESLGDILVNVPVILIFSLFIASLLNQKFRGRVVARTIFFIPVILSSGIVWLVGNWDLSYFLGTGAMDDMIGGAGTPGFNELLNSLNFSPQLMGVVTSAASGLSRVVQSSGMQIFIFLAAFQEIPHSLYEAAAVEGCSSWERFWKITIPMVHSQIVINAVYTLVDTYTKSGNPLFEHIENLAFSQNQYPTGVAMYLLYLLSQLVMLGVVTLMYSRIVRSE